MKKFLLAFVALLLPLTAAVAQQKLGVVNAQEIMAAMPEVVTVQTQLQELDKKYSAELQAMNNEYTKKADEFIKVKDQLSEAISKSRQQELVDLQNRIMQSEQAMRQDIEAQYKTLMAPVQKKVNDAIKKVGDANGFTYITDKSVMIYMGSSAQDVTALVKAELGIK